SGLPYAVFISAGNDGTGALNSIERIARGYPLKPVCDPIIARGELDAEVLEHCEELGETMASGVAWGIF
ncbi:MAG TPA: flavodoxin, partial [Candidatus Competibacteraceae bacterium]|nr:flavodoxin [Candidatus Competibacteraceae bacterium]